MAVALTTDKIAAGRMCRADLVLTSTSHKRGGRFLNRHCGGTVGLLKNDAILVRHRSQNWSGHQLDKVNSGKSQALTVADGWKWFVQMELR